MHKTLTHKMGSDIIDASNEAVVTESSYNTRHTGFSMDQSKQTNNLKRDALIDNYDTVINNYSENVNVKCSSGFYLKVGNPALLFLARQASDSSKPLVIDNIRIHCKNSVTTLDNHNLLVNFTYFYDLHCSLGNILGTVTIHSHVSTRLVQLQGSKLVGGMKAPVWFFKTVLKNTYDREGVLRKSLIDEANMAVINISPGDMKCNLCDKKYKTPANLQKHIKAKHEILTSQPVGRPLLKRRCSPVSYNDESEEDYNPPPKTIAFGSSSPESIPSTASVLIIESETNVVNSSFSSSAMVSVPCPPATSISSISSVIPPY